MLYLAALIFVSGFITLFWKEVPGEIVEHKILATTRVGNTGMTAMGATGREGFTMLSSIKYRYYVNGVYYSAYGVRFSGGAASLPRPANIQPAPIKVYYSTTFPFLSVIDRGIHVFLVFFLSLFGLGLIELHKWFIKHTTLPMRP